MKFHRLGMTLLVALITLHDQRCEGFGTCQQHSCYHFQQGHRSVAVLATSSNEEPEVVIKTIAPPTPSLADALNEIYEEEIKPDKGKAKKQTKTSKPRKRTKAQIKKLKFLMNSDVDKLIQENNSTAIEKAEDNIKRLQKLYETDGNPDYKPKILNYNMIVRAYGKSNLPDAPEQALRVLNELKEMYEETGDEEIRPTTITYTECIDAYAKSKRKNSAQKAEELLFLMMEESENEDGTTDDLLSPSSITCDVVLNAWARTRTAEGAARAEQILERMEYLRMSGNVKIQPTSYSFATVISAWAKTRPDRDNKTANAERAQSILKRMNDFRRSMSRSNDERDQEYGNQLYPDAVVYNAVLDAWARSRDPIAGTRAEDLLLEMEQLQKQDGKLTPDTITYNSIINCHASSGHMNAAKNAETVLKKMETARKNGAKNVSPNTLTYNQVLKTYSKCNVKGSAQRADMILRYMLQSGIEDIRPDVISFSTCLDVWAKSKEPGKAEKAYNILKKMIEFHKLTGSDKMKPNQVTYNTVLNACAFSAFTEATEKKQAMRIAVNLFNEMQKSDIKPDAITYGMMIKCIANLMPRGEVRNKMASGLFNNAKEKGLVNGLVFDEIRRAIPGANMGGLLKDCFRNNKKRKPLSEMMLRDLPRSWKANVVEAKPKRKKTKKKKEDPNAVEKLEPVPIKPMRRIVESSWQSGRDV